MEAVMVEEEIVFREKRHEYGSVYTFIFDTPNPTLSKSFQAGEYVHVRIPKVPEGEKKVREFSFAGTASDGEVWFGVDTRSGSLYQKTLLALEAGDTATLFKVKGKMALPTEKATVIMIAGGVGITPFRSMIREIQQKNLPHVPVLVHISREGFLYEEELRALPFEQHRVTRAEGQNALRKMTEKYPEAVYFLAGSENFVEGFSNFLHSLDIDPTRIFQDPFKGLSENEPPSFSE